MCPCHAPISPPAMGSGRLASMGVLSSPFFVLCGVVRCVFLLDTLPVSEGSSMRSRHLLKDFQYNPPCGGWIAPSRKMPRTSNQAFPLRGPASSPQNLSFFYFSSQEDRQDHQGVLATGYSAAAPWVLEERSDARCKCLPSK